MSAPITEHLRYKHRFMKTVAAIVLVTFVSLSLQPLTAAAQTIKTAAPKAEPDSSEKLAKTLEAIEAKLDKLNQKLANKLSADTEKAELQGLKKQLDDQDKTTLADFAKIEQHLRDHKLPEVILKRHTEAVKQYLTDMANLRLQLEDVDNAKDDNERQVKAQKAKKFLEAKQKKRTQQRFDPNDLPNKSLKPNLKNKPKSKRDDFVRAGLYDNPTVKLAALGDFKFDKLAGASDAAYLAPSAEVVLTDRIKAKAQELEYNPVKIYQWVRNNVEWLPTWGATQDADVTLGSRRGNDMDLAGLLIALYRASDIPARYVHGVIEVPADKFLNWTGGFTNIDAAANYVSAGGIPLATVVSGGRITKVQLEHVWVEAAVDFVPSRGAINKSADNWVQLDASIKQYQDIPGLDVLGITNIDPNTVAQSLIQSGTFNQAEGWVQGLNPAILQNAQVQAQTAVEQYITNNLPNPTIGDVIGDHKIVASNATVLSAGLPYRSIFIGARYGKLPDALQNKMTFGLGFDLLQEPVNPVTFPWARLNNHKVTLSFKPATAADEQTLASLLPPGITDPSQVPNSIPSYLITVVPQLAVDGQVVSQGNTMRLGEDFTFFYGVDRVTPGNSHTYTYTVPAGAYLGVAVSGGSVSSLVLQDLKTKMTQTQTTLQSGNNSLIGALTQEDILGDMFYAGSLGYFGEYIALSHVASVQQKAQHNLPYAYGTFGYEPNVKHLFGIPRAITPGGVAVNVRLGWLIEPKDGDSTRRPNLNFQTGLLSSALENGVPEQMFSTPTQPLQGVSAAKALRLASQQGQRIYHITQANQAQVLPNLHLDGLAMNEITQGLAVGKEVITHTDRISVPGFTGEGYIIFDPVSGSGAYKITGGNNGGFLAGLLLGSAIILYLALALTAVVLGPILGLLVLVALFGAIITSGVLIAIYGDDPNFWKCFKAGFEIALAIAGVRLAAGLLETLLALIGFGVASETTRECFAP
jgi:hypothetical protein